MMKRLLAGVCFFRMHVQSYSPCRSGADADQSHVGCSKSHRQHLECAGRDFYHQPGRSLNAGRGHVVRGRLPQPAWEWGRVG